MPLLIDLHSPLIGPHLSTLLRDRTTGRNIVWGTDSYSSLGDGFSPDSQIGLKALTAVDEAILQPRAMKPQDVQQLRTRQKAEVFTPLWVVAKMNDMLDEDWFGREGDVWTPAEGKIAFPKGRTWRAYVDSRRLEITCGEAPFIATRYDAATGEMIPPAKRAGILDRKLRVVNENAPDDAAFETWALRALQSVYGYEYQGDSLLIARINALLTWAEAIEARTGRPPDGEALKAAADVVSWNFWQMDGLTGAVPYAKIKAAKGDGGGDQISMADQDEVMLKDFAEKAAWPEPEDKNDLCRIYDWRKKARVTYVSMRKERGA